MTHQPETLSPEMPERAFGCAYEYNGAIYWLIAMHFNGVCECYNIKTHVIHHLEPHELTRAPEHDLIPRAAQPAAKVDVEAQEAFIYMTNKPIRTEDGKFACVMPAKVFHTIVNRLAVTVAPEGDVRMVLNTVDELQHAIKSNLHGEWDYQRLINRLRKEIPTLQRPTVPDAPVSREFRYKAKKAILWLDNVCYGIDETEYGNDMRETIRAALQHFSGETKQ